MPVCTSPKCWADGEEQPLDEFTEGERTCRYCRTCRQRQAAAKRNGRDSNPQAGKSAKQEHLEIGDPPKFASEADRVRWQNWLKGLLK